MKKLFATAALLVLLGAGCAKSAPENPYPGTEPYEGPNTAPPSGYAPQPSYRY